MLSLCQCGVLAHLSIWWLKLWIISTCCSYLFCSTDSYGSPGAHTHFLTSMFKHTSYRSCSVFQGPVLQQISIFIKQYGCNGFYSPAGFRSEWRHTRCWHRYTSVQQGSNIHWALLHTDVCMRVCSFFFNPHNSSISRIILIFYFTWKWYLCHLSGGFCISMSDLLLAPFN